MSMRIFGDAALPPEMQAVSFIEEHALLLIGVLAAVTAATVVLVVLLNRKKRGK